MNVRSEIESLVWRLRRPERFVQKLKAFMETQPVSSLAELEALVRNQGVEILHADLGPGVYGAATQCHGEPFIVLRPDLHPRHRELTLAHELGHVQLHLPGMSEMDARPLPTVGGIEDVEADTYAMACLMWKLPKQEELPRIAQYVRANPDMARRSWRMCCYFFLYRLRIAVANLLEALFIPRPLKGAH